MKEILLTQGQVALVDDGDFGWLSAFKWHSLWSSAGRTFYAGHSVRIGVLRMQNAIWGLYRGAIPKGFTVDHANRDTLDNRRSNLRLATRSQQSMNRRVLNRINTSGYRGVTRTRSGKWQAEITIDGKRIHLGTFNDPADAALAYDAAAFAHDPEFAQLNFPGCVDYSALLSLIGIR